MHTLSLLLGVGSPLSPFFLVFYVTKSPVKPIFFGVFVKNLSIYIFLLCLVRMDRPKDKLDYKHWISV